MARIPKSARETVFEYAETFTVGKLPTPPTLFKQYPGRVVHRSVIILIAGYPRRRADFRPTGPLQFFWLIGAVRGGFFWGSCVLCWWRRAGGWRCGGGEVRAYFRHAQIGSNVIEEILARMPVEQPRLRAPRVTLRRDGLPPLQRTTRIAS